MEVLFCSFRTHRIKVSFVGILTKLWSKFEMKNFFKTKFSSSILDIIEYQASFASSIFMGLKKLGQWNTKLLLILCLRRDLELRPSSIKKGPMKTINLMLFWVKNVLPISPPSKNLLFKHIEYQKENQRENIETNPTHFFWIKCQNKTANQPNQ